MSTKVFKTLFSTVTLAGFAALSGLAQNAVAQAKAVPYEIIRAAHDFAMKSSVAAERIAAYEWIKARLDEQVKEFQDIKRTIGVKPENNK